MREEEEYSRYIGQMFDGRYEILRLIGHGGMAVVFEALDTADNSRVAIKMLKEDIAGEERAVTRFVNESRAISMLSSENIVKVYHVSVDGPSKFIVMEYIEGITLKTYMDKKGIVSWSNTVWFTEQILSALNHAHGKGIVHRDIKPQNIMITRGGNVKVMDFGIAKIPKAESLTTVDKAIGTVYYISPEQARSHPIDCRSDLYSLGIMMYEMTTGRLPFVNENAMTVLMAHISETPKPPREYNPSIPVGLEQIILRLMEKNAENRYQSAGEVFRALSKLKSNPSIVFPNEKPAKTPTAEQNIRETIRHQEMFRSDRFDAVGVAGQQSSASQNAGNQQSPARQNAGYQQSPARQNAGYQQSPARQNAGYQQSPARQSAGYQQNPARQNAGYQQNPARQNAGYRQSASGERPISPRTPSVTPGVRTQQITNLRNLPKEPREKRESAPFAFVVLICIVFLALALVGLGVLFGVAISSGCEKTALWELPMLLRAVRLPSFLL